MSHFKCGVLTFLDRMNQEHISSLILPHLYKYDYKSFLISEAQTLSCNNDPIHDQAVDQSIRRCLVR